MGVSRYFEKVTTSQTKWKLLQNAGYLFLLSLLLYIVLFPLDYYRYHLSKSYGISTQAFASWMKDGVIDFWVNFGTSLIIVTVIYWLIKRVKKVVALCLAFNHPFYNLCDVHSASCH